MFDKKIKKAIAKSVSTSVKAGADIEQAIEQAIAKAEDGNLQHNTDSENPAVVKNFSFDVKSVDTEGRTVEGYAATWDIDQVDDIIHKGAFAKSIRERMPDRIKLLSQHDVLIGKPLEMIEDEKGLYVKAYISDTTRGNDDLQLVKDGVLDRFSIGFSIPGGKFDIDDKGIRHIYEVKLMEFSLVTFPANEEAIVTSAKEKYEEDLEEKREEVEKDKESDLEIKEIFDSVSEVTDFARLRLY